MNMSGTQRGSAVHIIIIVVLATLLVGLVGFVFWQNFIVQKDMPAVVETPVAAPEGTSELTTLKEFRTKQHDISFQYPQDWTVEELVDEGSTDMLYISSTQIKNAQGKLVAQLSLGGGVGGACDDEAPFIATSTFIKDELTVPGIGPTNFGYTAVDLGVDSKYGVTYGLADSDLPFGDVSVQCPGMAVNYKYIVETANKPAVGSLIFGRWNNGANDDTGVTFSSKADAEAYAKTEEFLQIKAMIESLKIGE